MLSRMAALHAYQILAVDHDPSGGLPGFNALVDAATDWAGYGAIRDRLMNTPLDEQAFYGFFSTAHGEVPAPEALADDAARADPATDVLLCAHGPRETAYFWNVFEQGESACPGLLGVAQRCFARLGQPLALEALVCESRRMAQPNGYLARPRFWRAWLAVAEALYVIAEDPGDELGAALRAPSGQRGAPGRPMKLLVFERIATFLLMTEPRLYAQMPARLAAQASRSAGRLALTCEALKLAYATTGRSQYRVVFRWLRGFAVGRHPFGPT